MAFDPPSNVSTATQMIEWINSTTSQWLFQGIIGSVFFIALMGMLKNPANSTSKSFVGAAFATMVISVFARVLNLVPTWFMSVWIILVGLGALWTYVEGIR